MTRWEIPSSIKLVALLIVYESWNVDQREFSTLKIFYFIQTLTVYPENTQFKRASPLPPENNGSARSVPRTRHIKTTLKHVNNIKILKQH